MYLFKFLPVLAALLPTSAFAADIDIPTVQIFAGGNTKSWQEKLDIDCKDQSDFNSFGIDELNKLISKKAFEYGIGIDSSSNIELKVSLTDFSCNENGLEDNFHSPLGLYTSEETTAQAVLRVVYEIFDKTSQRLLDSGEIIVSGENKEEKGNFTWYQKEHRIKAFNPEKAWILVVDKIIQKTKRFL